MITALPNNVTTIDEARMIGLAGLYYIGEAIESPEACVTDGNGSAAILIFSDGSLLLLANASEIYPSVGGFLVECGDNETELTRQLIAHTEAAQ